MGLNRFHAHFQHLGRETGTEASSTRRFRKGKRVDRNGIGRKIKGFSHRVGYTMLTFLFQAFPLPQGSAFRPSLEYTGELVDAGCSILIFPEGKVSEDGSIGTFKGGVSLIAEKTGIPVIPVRISGMHEVLPPGRWFPRRGDVHITFSAAMAYKYEGHEQFALKLEQTVRSLYPGSVDGGQVDKKD
jgi:hypothetical protein